MDAFYGCYRTESRYYSLFAAVYILMRVVNLIAFSTVGGVLYFNIAGYVFMLALVLVALVKPYRNKWHNWVDIMLLISIVTYNQYINFKYEIMYIGTGPLNRALRIFIVLFIVIFPAIYALFIMTWHLMPRCAVKKLTNCCFQRELEESLPHRIKQSNECSPLI